MPLILIFFCSLPTPASSLVIPPFWGNVSTSPEAKKSLPPEDAILPPAHKLFQEAECHDPHTTEAPQVGVWANWNSQIDSVLELIHDNRGLPTPNKVIARKNKVKLLVKEALSFLMTPSLATLECPSASKQLMTDLDFQIGTLLAAAAL